ncbi:MAG: ABC transporter substrate-binding protein [Acidimicrobiales bacterium]
MLKQLRGPTRLLLSLLVIMSLFAAACGDDDDTSAGDDGATTDDGTNSDDGTTTDDGTNSDDGTEEPAETVTVTIGLMEDLSGPIEPFGRKVVNGAVLAVEQFNASQDAIIVETVEEDTASDQANAGPSMRQLAGDDSVLAVLGPTATTAIPIASPLAEEIGLTVLAPTSTGALEDGVLNEWMFRVAPITGPSFPVAVGEMKDLLGFETVGIFYDPSNASSQGEVDLLNANAEALGYEIVGTETAEAGQTDLSGVVSNLAGENPDAIWISHADIAVMSAFMIQARERGIEADFIGAAPFTNAEIFELAGDAGEGSTTFVPFLASNPEVADFVAAYEERWGEAPDVFAAEGYAGTQVLLNAIANAAELTRAAVRDAVAATAGLQTVIGSVTYGGSQDNTTPELVVVRVEGGQFVAVG